MSVSRREFLKRGAAAGLVGGGPAAAGARRARGPPLGRPPSRWCIASMNGNWYKNGGPVTCVEKAFTQMTARRRRARRADRRGQPARARSRGRRASATAGCPTRTAWCSSTPAACTGRSERAGGVAGLEGVRTPSNVAQAVMDQTDHHLLVGAGAQAFARGLGFTIEPDLNTEHSRKAWLEWKRRIGSRALPGPESPGVGGAAGARSLFDGRLLDPRGTARHDQLQRHQRARARSAASRPPAGWPGRSPAASATRRFSAPGSTWTARSAPAGRPGRGEANLYNLSSFLIVENIRRGMHPKDAGLDALRARARQHGGTRLRRPNGEPNFSLSFYILNAKGEHAGVSMYAENDDYRGWAGQHRPRLHEVRRMRPERAPVVQCEGARARHPQAGGIARAAGPSGPGGRAMSFSGAPVRRRPPIIR